MRRLLLGCSTLLACLLLLSFPNPAKANIVNFDDLQNEYDIILDGYQGLRWAGWSVLGSWYQNLEGNGAFPSSPIAAASMDAGTATISVPSGTFNAGNAYFSSYVYSGNYMDGYSATQITITGSQNGQTVGSPVVIDLGPSFSLAALNLNGIDTLTIVATGQDGGPWFVMDDFSYAPVPLPPTVLLLGPGLAGLALLRRRYRL
jgi:hypothetical protein